MPIVTLHRVKLTVYDVVATPLTNFRVHLLVARRTEPFTIFLLERLVGDGRGTILTCETISMEKRPATRYATLFQDALARVATFCEFIVETGCAHLLAFVVDEFLRRDWIFAHFTDEASIVPELTSQLQPGT